MNNRLIVLHSFPTWLPQTQTWMHTQVQELQRRGLETHVVCERTENLEQFQVDNIHSLDQIGIVPRTWDRAMRKLKIRQHLDFVRRIGQETGARILHSHFGNVGWANRGAVRACGAKHVVTFYGLDVNQLPTRFPAWRSRYRDLFAEVDRVLCEGSHMARCIVELGCPERKLMVHHLGIAVDNIQFLPRRWVEGEPLRVLIAASFREKKGIPYAINALGKVARDVPMRLTIVGDAGGDTDSRTEKYRILAALDRTDLRRHTRLLGYQPHELLLREAYGHHVFMQASVTASDGDTEGGAPVSIIEMLATGMPVVSTQHCDIPEVVGPALAHWLAPERDVVALEEVLRRLLAKATDWEALTTTARNHVVRNYDRRQQSLQLITQYRQLVAGE